MLSGKKLELDYVDMPDSTPFATTRNFDTRFRCSSNYLNTDDCYLEVYSTDCALKSSAGKSRNCLNNEWRRYSSIYINAYYYTNNNNVNSYTSSNNNSHCITFRGRVGNNYTDNELGPYCYYIY